MYKSYKMDQLYDLSEYNPNIFCLIPEKEGIYISPLLGID